MMIQGRKGGDSHTPVEAQDTLRTTQIGEVVDLISEGECEGLANGLQDYFLDGVPVENPDGTKNFEVEFVYNVGSIGQPALAGLAGVLNEKPVGVQVLKATPIVRTVTDPDVDTARVTIGIPQLSEQDTSSGDLNGSSFTFAIDVQDNAGGFVQRYVRTVIDKNMTLATLSVDIAFNGPAPHDIRVRRVSDDSSNSAVVNAFSWMTYTEIISRKLRYPNSAVALSRFNAQQFSTFPARSWRWRGVKVLVPSNYNPVTREYTGTWDGTFIRRWTNNPAWCFNAMVTTERWGLGRYVSQALQDKWTLYKIGQYCDGMVPDGFGGMEPRFTCNWCFNTQEEAYNVLQDLATVFRTMVYWGNSGVLYSQDAPQQPRLLYSPANVVDGVFTPQDVSEKTLHSVFICYWQDMSQQGKRVPEILSDDALIQRYGVRELTIESIACTSRGQAARLCRWARYVEQMESELRSFKVGADGDVAALGDVFKIHDPDEAGEQLGGRIRSATTGQLVLDREIELLAGETCTVTVMLPDPDNIMQLVTEVRTVITPAGTTGVLNVSPSFSQAPRAESVWIVETTAVQATLWRCLSNGAVDGSTEHEITGVAYNPSKFDAIELGLVLDVPSISRLSAIVRPPTGLTLTETVYTDGTVNKSRLTAAWLPSAPNLDHLVSWRKDTGWWQALPRTSSQTVDIGNLDAGVYEVIVRSINPLGTISLATQASITLQGGRSGIRAVRLQASSLTFKVPTVGAVSPASVSIAADVGALAGPAQWAVVSGTATLSGSDDNLRSLAYADMGSEVVTVSATVVDGGQTYTDMVSIFKVRDGAPGTRGDDGNNGSDGTDGQPGQAAVTALLSLEALALPADASGAVTTYEGAFTSMVVMIGEVDDTANWTFTRLNSSGVTSTLTAAHLVITAMSESVDLGFVDITATRSGYASLTKRLAITKVKSGSPGTPGTDGLAGPRGSVSLAHPTTGTTWNDSEATAAIYAAGYADPVNLDVVTLYNSDANWSEARMRVDGAWQPIAAYITGNMMVDGTIGARQLVVQGGVGSSLWNDPNCQDPSAWRAVAGFGGLPTFTTTTTGNTGANIMSSGPSVATADGWPMVPVSASKTYRISARVRAQGGADGQFFLRYVWSGTAKGDRTAEAGVEAYTPTTDWVRCSFELTPAVGAKFIAPRVVLNWQGTTGTVQVQDIRIEELLDSALIVQGGIKADRISVESLAAISANVGNLLMNTAGSIRAGQTDYNVGTGFWLGYKAGAYKFSIGNGTNGGLTWDGSNLLISGKLTADAVDAIDTINIKGNAVTIPVFSQWSGRVGYSSGGWTTLLSTPSVDFQGSTVSVTAYIQGTAFNESDQPGVTMSLRVRIIRDGGVEVASSVATVQGASTLIALGRDTPGSGSHWYSVQIYSDGAYGDMNKAVIDVKGIRR